MYIMCYNSCTNDDVCVKFRHRIHIMHCNGLLALPWLTIDGGKMVVEIKCNVSDVDENKHI